MELKMSKAGVGRKPMKIKVTDCDGNYKIFDTVKNAAEYMSCNVQSIYSALCYGKTVRGCKLERVL